MAWQARSPNHSLDLTITGKARRRALSEERRRDVVSRHTMQGMRVPVAGVVVAEAIYLPSEAGGRVATCANHSHPLVIAPCVAAEDWLDVVQHFASDASAMDKLFKLIQVSARVGGASGDCILGMRVHDRH